MNDENGVYGGMVFIRPAQPELCWAIMEIGREFGLAHKAHNEPLASAQWRRHQYLFQSAPSKLKT